MKNRVCVIGWPIHHSKSPLIHGYWLKSYGIDGTYKARAVEPKALGQFVKDAWDAGLAGFNATLPHKEALMQLVEPDAISQAIGAINTVYRGREGFVGTNTDGIGWWRSLAPTTPPRSALVIGAGGAAKAVIHALCRHDVKIWLMNRTRARAESLGHEVLDWTGPEIDGRGYDLIVNTSSCGMNGNNPIRLSALDRGTLVSDLVYTPLNTELLMSAQALGGLPIDGLGMLLHQAAGGFERWFGTYPKVTEALRESVLRG